MKSDLALQDAHVAQSRALLQALQGALSILPKAENAQRAEVLDVARHAVITVANSAGPLGQAPIFPVAQAVGRVLGDLRDGTVGTTPDLLGLLRACGEHLGALVDAVETSPADHGAALADAGRQLMTRLEIYLEPAPLLPAMEMAEVPQEDADLTRIGHLGINTDNWHLSLRFGRDVLRKGMDPLSFLRHLNTLGEIVGIVTLHDALPAADEMDPTSCYLGFEVSFRSDATKAAIEGAFEHVLDDCLLHILPPNSLGTDYIGLIQALPEDSGRLGEILVRCGTLTAHELEATLALQARSDLAAPIGQILAGQGRVQPAVIEAALSKQKRLKASKAESRLVGVDAAKLQEVIELADELALALGAGAKAPLGQGLHEPSQHQRELARLAEAVRDGALALRPT